MKPKILTCLLLVCLLLSLGTALAQGNAGEEDSTFQYMVKRLEGVVTLGAYETWTPEQKADLDEIKKGTPLITAETPVHIRPTPELLSQEEAQNAAMAAIAAQYRVKDADWGKFRVDYELLAIENSSREPWWRISLQAYEVISPYSAYVVELNAKTGEVSFVDGGESWLIPYEGNRTPQPGDITREEAVKIAWDYVVENALGYNGLTEELLGKFDVDFIIFIYDDWGRVFNVEFHPRDSELFNYFGTYGAMIDPITGVIVSGGKGNG